MQKRILGRTGREVSPVGLGTWQLGVDRGDVSEDDALAVLRAADEEGVTLLDTADVSGDGRSAGRGHSGARSPGIRGETFSGVDFEVGIQAANELAAALPDGVSLPQASLAWIMSRPGVTAVIPGARNPRQAVSNAEAAALLEQGFDVDAFDVAVRDVYDRLLRADIHPLWYPGQPRSALHAFQSRA